MRIVNAVLGLLRREPALVMGAASAAVSLGADFGLHLSVSQQLDVYGVATALTAFIVRQAVTPNVKVLSVDQRLGALEAAVSELGSVPTIAK